MMNLAVRTKQGFTSRKMPPDLGYVKVLSYFTLERNDWVYSCVNFVCDQSYFEHPPHGIISFKNGKYKVIQ